MRYDALTQKNETEVMHCGETDKSSLSLYFVRNTSISVASIMSLCNDVTKVTRWYINKKKHFPRFII